jgi:hypothetical protein
VRIYKGSALALEICVFLFLFLPVAIWSQMVQPALGRLYIISEPKGADITINGTLRPEKTNVTLVVSPGTYTVSVSGGAAAGHFSCSAQVTVSAGQTATVSGVQTGDGKCPTK